MNIKVTDIVYDTDGESDLDLPTEMTLVINDFNDSVDIETDIADAISDKTVSINFTKVIVNGIETDIADAICDKTGWCAQSYNYEIL